MKHLALALTLVLLVGCSGGTEPSDSMAGTWRTMASGKELSVTVGSVSDGAFSFDWTYGSSHGTGNGTVKGAGDVRLEWGNIYGTVLFLGSVTGDSMAGTMTGRVEGVMGPYAALAVTFTRQ